MIKKGLLVTLTTLLLMTSLSLPIFGESFNFVQSPNKDEIKEVSIVDGKEIEGGGYLLEVKREDGCIDDVVLTPYKYRDNIKNEDSYNQLVEAYKTIEEAENLGELNADLEKLANDKGATVYDLSVRYLFDVTIYENYKAETHEENLHGIFVELPVEFEDLDDFICLMVYVDGEWTIVEGAYIDPTNPRRMFIPIVTGSGAYALVVANDYNYVPAVDFGCIIHWIILLLALITGIIQFITTHEDEINSKDAKAIRLIRTLIIVIDVVFSLILYIFYRHCELDIIALLINFTFVLLSYLISIKDKNEKKY